MKKLTKLNINPKKVMKNEELVTLRGGYGEGGYMCECGDGVWAHDCAISLYGMFCFRGWACGSTEHIKEVYPPEQGFTIDCGTGTMCESGRIGG